jgi:2-desacetyl-2-hydroxyethyl bacteriochlorophyllide A dehydrogenase
MSTMQAERLFGPMDMRVVEVPVPELGPHDVLCQVVRSGVCGTDYAIYTGEFRYVKNGGITFPMTLGHEWSGIVAQVGPAVQRLAPGDRVVGDTGVACGNCNECLVGDYFLCTKAQAVGTINAWDGAYAEYIMMPERHLFPLPDSVSFDNGALVEPAATALYAVVKAGVRIGDTVLVQGSGPIGIAAAKLAKLSGASRVIITGRQDFKLQKALALGVDAAVNTRQESVAAAVLRHTGQRQVDCLVEAAGSVELLKESISLVRPGGTVAVVAFYEQTMPDFDIDGLVFADVTLRPVAGSLGMYRPILRLMASGMLDLTSLITGTYPLLEARRAMADIRERNETRIKIMMEGGG